MKLRTYLLALSLMTSVAGCDEANGSLPPPKSSSKVAEPATSAPPIVSTVAAPMPEKMLPLSAISVKRRVILLQCGQTYHGTLDLKGRSDITVTTEGDCGKANITPGRAIAGWTKHKGSIYSAPIDFHPMQVSVSGKPVDAAHWPNRPTIWANGETVMPHGDLHGATLVYLDNQSVIKTQTVNGDYIDISKPFYVEGKLWMLDSPGEWAVHDGRLYLWAADGQSPEGRVWAAPESNGINADHSTNITIDGVRVFSSANGISGDTSTNLRVLNSEIINSARDGIWASGSKGLKIHNTKVTNSGRNGISGGYSIVGAVITNSTVTNSGTVGKHKPTDAGIMFGDGRDNRIDNVRVINSGYHGISVLHNWHTSVTNSVVDTACVNLTDCGGIYTGARDRLPLNLRLEGNVIINVAGHEGVGIYLDDFANGVTVSNNKISNSTRGMMIHNGFDNIITHNTFASNKVTHLKFTQDQGRIRNNRVTHNTFRSTNNEQTFNLETGSNLREFAIFDHNTYVTTNPGIFSRSWDGKSDGVSYSYKAWKRWMGQDTHSKLTGIAREKSAGNMRRVAADR